MVSKLLRCLSKPLGKKAGERITFPALPLLNNEDASVSTVVAQETEVSESESAACFPRIRCLSRPRRKEAGEKTKCCTATLLTPDDTSTSGEQDPKEPELESDIKGHLLLRLLGGECYGAASSSTCSMGSDLWSMFPYELLPTVLSFLPFISKLRFRVVCKEWRMWLSSSECRHQRSPLHAPRTPLVCAFRFVRDSWMRDYSNDHSHHGTPSSAHSSAHHGRHFSASPETRQLQQKLRCREVPLTFPDVDSHDSRGLGCRIGAKVSAEDGVLTVEVWKERQLLHGNLRRHRGVPTVLDLFTFLVNPVTETVLSLPQLRTEGDHTLGRNLGLVSTKVVSREGRFYTSSFYWTCWWLDVGFGLRQSTSWFTRVRRHPIEAGRYPESVNVRDRSGERNVIGVGITEMEGGHFQAVISDGVVYGVHYLPDGRNRLLTRTLHASQMKQWSQWHEEACVPKINNANDLRFFLVEHRVSHSVFYVGQSCNESGRLICRICRLQSDCYPAWFWLPISVMPSEVLDQMMIRLGAVKAAERPTLDRAFVAGDYILLVCRIAGRPAKVCMVAFDVHEETWQVIFTEADSEELADFDGFFEVRPDLRFARDVKDGMKLY